MNDADQIKLAQQGDDAAAAAIISSYLPYWMSAARQIIATDVRTYSTGGPRVEPTDLVQEAVLNLLDQWKKKQGAASNPRSYVTATMRNNYANKFRSPRSRERSIDEFAFEETLIVDDFEPIDTSRETALMRRALTSLAPDHQTVLQSVTIEGMKPGDLTVLLDRPAPAVSNLLARAKKALFRQVLIEHLREGGTTCKENAEKLPARVSDDHGSHGSAEPGVDHVHKCEDCQRNWRRFATIMSAFGLLPLLTVTQLANGSTPAAAAGESTSGQAPLDPSHAIYISPDSSGNRLPSDPGQAETAAAAENKISVTSTARTTGRLLSVLSSQAVLVIGVVSLSVFALALGAHTFLGSKPHQAITTSSVIDGKNPYEVSFDVALETADNGALLSIRANFAAQDQVNLTVHQMTLQLSPGTELRSTPNGLQCETANKLTTCDPVGDHYAEQSIVFEVNNPDPGGSFDLKIDARAGEDSIRGKASGQW